MICCKSIIKMKMAMNKNNQTKPKMCHTNRIFSRINSLLFSSIGHLKDCLASDIKKMYLNVFIFILKIKKYFRKNLLEA